MPPRTHRPHTIPFNPDPRRSKNGNRLRTAFTNVRNGAALAPTVGLHSRGETLSLNFGGRPFRFDLEGMLAEEAAAERAAVRAAPLPPGAALAAVRQYLLHYGYARTLAALDEAAGTGGEGEEQQDGGGGGGSGSGGVSGGGGGGGDVSMG